MKKPKKPKKLYVVMTRYKGSPGMFCCAYEKKKEALAAQRYELFERWNASEVCTYELVEEKEEGER